VRRHAALVVAAAAVAAFWLRTATTDYAPSLEAARPSPVYDYFSYYRPNAEYAFGRLRAGDLPLWNPLQQLGGPFLATLQTGVLYPPNALHLALPAQPAFAWLAAAHLVLAALAAGALARACGAGAVGAAAAGALYGGSLQLWGAVWTPPTLYAAAWMPAVLAAIVALAERPTPRRAAAFAALLALQLLVGWPYTVAMTAVVGAIVGGAVLGARAWRERALPAGSLLALAAGALGGVLLAAPQLLPALELMGRSARALGTLDEGTAGLGGAMHEPGPFFARLLATGASDGVPGLAAPLLALAAIALAGPGRGRTAALLGAGGLALAASFPRHLPVYDALQALPVLGDFRFPFRWRLVATLALAVAAGVGTTRLAALAGRHFGARARVPAALALAGLALAIEAVPIARLQSGTLFAFPRRPARPVQELAGHLEVVGRPEHSAARSLWLAFGLDKFGQRKGIRVLQDLEPLSLGTTSRMMQFFARGEAGAARAGVVAPVLGAPYFGSVPLPADPGRIGLLDLAAVRFVAMPEAPEWARERWDPVAGVVEPLLFENPHALPRAWRALRAEPEPDDPQAALERLVAPDFDLRTTVLLAPMPADAPAGQGGDPSAETAIEVDDAERVVVRTRGATPALLVLADAWFPGWEASLDGAAVPVLRADTALRAVAVPAGEHVVEWRYRPRAFRLGLALSAAAALTLASLSRKGPGSNRQLFTPTVES
jgi:hypothetical protein